MNDIFNQITGDKNFLQKLLSKIPGFSGYMEQKERRAADKVLREFIAAKYEDLWKRISGLQAELISQGQLEYIDDVEAAAIKLRQFIDRVRTASYGYAPFFDAIKIKEEELAQVYQYDVTLLEMAETVSRGVDNLEQSIGTDGIGAAIRNLKTLTQQCVDAFNKRAEVMKLGGESAAQ